MATEEFRLASSGIDNEGRLPRKYTQEGQGARKNWSPPLEWYNVPDGAKTLALVVQDVDEVWTHWVVVNIPPGAKGLPEGFSGNEDETEGEFAGVKEGINDGKVPGWCGPDTPSNNKIEFRLYALDVEIHLGNKVTKEKLLDMIQGHVLGEAVLMANF